MVKAKKFIYAESFRNEPTLANFKLEEEDLPELENGGKNLLKLLYKLQLHHDFFTFNLGL